MRKLIALALVVLSVLAVSPTPASAQWCLPGAHGNGCE